MNVLRPALVSIAGLLVVAACKSSTASNVPSGAMEFASSFALTQFESHTDSAVAHWAVADGQLVAQGTNIQSVIVRKGITFENGWVETTTSRADDGGLILRFKSARDYYELAFRDDSAPSPRGFRNLALYHHIGPYYRELVTVGVDWTRGTTHTIRFESHAGALKAYFDGGLKLTFTPTVGDYDASPSTGPGGIGLRAYGGDGSWRTTFDNFRWQAEDGS